MTQSDSFPRTANAVNARFPASPSQRQMWFLEQVMPGTPTQNIALRWELTGVISQEALQQAFQLVIDRHEILRTRFAEGTDDVMQDVMDDVPFTLGHIDLRTLPASEHAARIAAIADQNEAVPFDLTKPGLLRVVLVRVAADRCVLSIVAHHLVFDGYSIGILAQEVGTAAAAIEAGLTPSLPDLPIQFGDFTLWQLDDIASSAGDDDTAYWSEQLKGAPYFEVETDKPRPAQQSARIDRVSHDLPHDFGLRLGRAASAQGVSSFTFAAATVSAALHRVSGATEVLLTTPISGRVESDLERVIGPIINQQVLRFQTPPTLGFTTHLTQSRAVIEGAIAHQNVPFSKLVELVNPVRDTSRAPLTAVCFNMLEVFFKKTRFGPFEMISLPSYTPAALQDLNIIIVSRGSGWRITVEYCPDLFARDTADGLLKSIVTSFDQTMAAPETVLSALPLDPRLAARQNDATRHLKRLEEALAAHPEVSAAAALADQDGIFAYVSPRGESQTPLEQLPAELARYLALRLRPDECPRGISILATLPRAASGDVDYARLPRPKPVAAVATTSAAQALAPVSVEFRLAAIWSEMLSIPTPPHDKSFFELGGHSLLAVRLMARIRKEFGTTLGVATIYENATIQRLAAQIESKLSTADDAIEDDWRIEPLQTEGTAQRIIAVNDVAIMVSALSHMKDTHPATCVRLFDGTRGIDQSERTFDEIAAEYAKVVRKVQPHGPYVLFGVCVHGNIAIETARHLQNQGEEIRALILKDVWEPGFAGRMKADSSMRWKERGYALRNRFRMVRNGTLSFTALLGSYRLIRKSGLMHLLVKLGMIDRVRATDLEPEQERFVSYISRARNKSRPAPLNMPVLHIITSITPRGRWFPKSIGWEDVVTGPLKTVQIKDVLVHRATHVGTDELAREIDTFLAERDAAAR